MRRLPVLFAAVVVVNLAAGPASPADEPAPVAGIPFNGTTTYAQAGSKRTTITYPQ